MNYKLSVLLCTSLIVLSSAVSATETLRIGIETAYPPFASRSASGEIQGFDYDIGNALCAQMQVKCQWVVQAFDGLIPSLKVKKVNAVLSSLSITDARRKSVDFTAPYYQSASRLVMRLGATPGDDFSGLSGKRLGVQRASTHDRFASDRLFPGGVAIVRYASLNEAYLDLIAGRLDAVQGDDIAVQLGFLDTGSGKGFAFAGEPLRDPRYFGEGVGIAVRKGDHPLAEQFNSAIAAIRASGEYTTIQNRYFTFDIYGS
jgi:arginine/ornithine transport system substrate-binding protein